MVVSSSITTLFSKKTQWSLTPNLLDSARHDLIRKGVSLIDLTNSNPTTCDFKFYSSSQLGIQMTTPIPRYNADPKGILEAREQICTYYGSKNISISPDQVFITSSTSEAYGFLFRLLTNPNDSILGFKPSYPLIEYLCSLHDITHSVSPLIYQNQSWRINSSDMFRELNSKTKAITCIHPNNPTGFFINDEDKEILIKTCAENNMALISDEVFLDYSYDFKSLSFANNNECLTFVLSGLSKVLCLPQMKLSWIIVDGPEYLRKEAQKKLEIISDTFLSVNSLSQLFLGQWMRNRGLIQKEVLERIRQNRNFLKTALDGASDIHLMPSQGGWNAILKVKNSSTDEKMALQILKKHHVLVYPGYLFDLEEGHLVISLIVPAHQFKSGITSLLSCISTSSIPLHF